MTQSTLHLTVLRFPHTLVCVYSLVADLLLRRHQLWQFTLRIAKIESSAPRRSTSINSVRGFVIEGDVPLSFGDMGEDARPAGLVASGVFGKNTNEIKRRLGLPHIIDYNFVAGRVSLSANY